MLKSKGIKTQFLESSEQHANSTDRSVTCNFLSVLYNHLTHRLHGLRYSAPVSRCQRWFWALLELQNHASGTDQLSSYDFLLAFYGELRPRSNCCQVISCRSQQKHNPKKKNNYNKNASTELLLLCGMAWSNSKKEGGKQKLEEGAAEQYTQHLYLNST